MNIYIAIVVGFMGVSIGPIWFFAEGTWARRSAIAQIVSYAPLIVLALMAPETRVYGLIGLISIVLSLILASLLKRRAR